MTKEQFEFEVDRIYFRYCPILLEGAIYDVESAEKFSEHMSRMKAEVMALKGVEEKVKKQKGEQMQNDIIAFIKDHNKHSKAGKKTE